MKEKRKKLKNVQNTIKEIKLKNHRHRIRRRGAKYRHRKHIQLNNSRKLSKS
jgi:hypothetical protein